MKGIFFHSHKFREIDGEYYSLGGLNDDVLSRYTKYFDELIVFARILKEDSSNKSKYSKITDSKVKIYDYRKIKKSIIKNTIETSDAVIVRLPCFIGLKAIRFSIQKKKKYLTEVVACAWDSYWNHGILGKILTPYIYMATRKCIKNSTNVVYVSNSFLQKRYPSKGYCIGCSDVQLKKISNDILERRLGRIKNERHNKKIILGTIGAVDVKYKGQKYVINAIKKLKKEGFINIEYQIVGSGDQSYLMNKARKQGVSENISFKGSLDHDSIFDWLDTIDIYIQPSLVEGLCRSLVEAMSRGCPCIASDAGGNVELIDKKYIFHKKNVNDLCKKIKIIMNDLEDASTYNFNKSEEFDCEKLKKKREKYYKEFICN